MYKITFNFEVKYCSLFKMNFIPSHSEQPLTITVTLEDKHSSKQKRQWADVFSFGCIGIRFSNVVTTVLWVSTILIYISMCSNTVISNMGQTSTQRPRHTQATHK